MRRFAAFGIPTRPASDAKRVSCELTQFLVVLEHLWLLFVFPPLAAGEQ